MRTSYVCIYFIEQITMLLNLYVDCTFSIDLVLQSNQKC